MAKTITILAQLVLGFFFFLFPKNGATQSPYCTALYNYSCTDANGFGVVTSRFSLYKDTTALLSDSSGCTATAVAAAFKNYQLVTATPPALLRGHTYVFGMTFLKTDKTETDAGYAIWIDFDNNNLFEPLEKIAIGTGIAPSSTITIPLTVSTGYRRMRVMSRKTMVTGQPQAQIPTDPCATSYDMGDVHDYTVRIVACANTPSVKISPTAVCPNSAVLLTAIPTNGGLNPQFFWSKNNIPQGISTFLNKNVALNGLGSDNVRSVFIGKADTIYAATENGLSISTNGGAIFSTKTQAVNGLGANFVNNVFVTPNGTIYAATSNGLSISTDIGVSFSNKNAANGLVQTDIKSVFVDSSGIIYAATAAGLAISRDGGAAFNNKTKVLNGLGSDMVNCVYVTIDGKIFAATQGGGLSISTDGGATFSNRTKALNGLANDTLMCVYVALDGRIFVGTSTAGLSISNDGGATFKTKDSTFLGNNSTVTSIFVGLDNRIYVTTAGGGLSISSDGGLSFSQKNKINDGLGSDNLNGVFVGKNGKIYVANLSNGGLSIATQTTTNTFQINNAVKTDVFKVVFVPSADACPSVVSDSAVIKTEDKTPPSVFCKAVTVQLNQWGVALLDTLQVDNNSTDNCSILNRSLSKMSFNCLNLGTNTVIFTATDASLNTATCSATVTVEDKWVPSVFCKPVTIQVNNLGLSTLNTVQIDNNSTDNCGITTRSLSKTAFNCTNLGTNTVVFTATDASLNSSTCSATITVEDKIEPTITCPSNMIVQLASGECQRAVFFKATATDNCTASPTIVQLAGLKSGEFFGLGTFNTGFKATDGSGNTSFCTFSITVKENTPDGGMACIGQTNVAIDASCLTKVSAEFLLTGEHYRCFDNYSIQLQTMSGTILTDAYLRSEQIGTTLRVIVTDNTLNVRCQGLIKVLDATPPTIEAPPTAVVSCDKVGANGIPLSTVSGEPTIVQECSLPTSFFYTDAFFNLNCNTPLSGPPTGFPADMSVDYGAAFGSKRIIVRTFHVSDRYGNTSKTRQAIYIKTNQLFDMPTPKTVDWTCGNIRIAPSDTVINGVTVAGTGYPTLPNGRSLGDSYCPFIATYSDVRTGATTVFSIRRSWTLFNPCTQQTINLVQTINVRDAPPTLVLGQNLTRQIPVSRRIDVSANNLIETLTDDCTVRANMVLGIRKVGTGSGFPQTSMLTLTCDDVGNYPIEVWASDEVGNIAIKNAVINVKDDGGNCVKPNIAGMIQRENGTDVPAKMLLFNNLDLVLDSVTGIAYNFQNLTANTRFRITPTRPNTDWINGVTMFDVALMSKHVLGIESLSTPYILISADANRSGDIDAVDMLLLQRLVLRTIPALPNNNSWRFVLKNFVFSDPTAPFSSDFPESLLTPNLTTGINNGHFVAIKIGDVNLSAGSLAIRGGVQPFILSVEDRVLERNKTYDIPIKIAPFQKDFDGRNLTALQFALNIDKNAAKISYLTQGDLPNCTENNVGLFKNEGIVTAGWYRTPTQKFVENDTFTFVNLTIQATANTRLSDILTLNPVYTEGVAYNETGNGAPIKLSFSNTIKAIKPILLPNRPNPFSEATTIAFVLPETSVAKLTVFDLMGRILMQTEKTFDAGLNEVIFDAKGGTSRFSRDVSSVSSGILMVRLQTGKSVLEQKVVFISSK